MNWYQIKLKRQILNLFESDSNNALKDERMFHLGINKLKLNEHYNIAEQR